MVSHDRYLMERVTDQQYAVIDGSFRHLPGGVDEYLALSAAGAGGSAAGSAQARSTAPTQKASAQEAEAPATEDFRCRATCSTEGIRCD